MSSIIVRINLEVTGMQAQAIMRELVPIQEQTRSETGREGAIRREAFYKARMACERAMYLAGVPWEGVMEKRG